MLPMAEKVDCKSIMFLDLHRSRLDPRSALHVFRQVISENLVHSGVQPGVTPGALRLQGIELTLDGHLFPKDGTRE